MWNRRSPRQLLSGTAIAQPLLALSSSLYAPTAATPSGSLLPLLPREPTQPSSANRSGRTAQRGEEHAAMANAWQCCGCAGYLLSLQVQTLTSQNLQLRRENRALKGRLDVVCARLRLHRVR